MGWSKTVCDAAFAIAGVATLAACDDTPGRRPYVPVRSATNDTQPAEYDDQPFCALDGVWADAGSDAGGGGAAPASAPDAQPSCQGGKVVHFVYFVEADRVVSECRRADIERQAYALQQFWFEQLGATFYLNSPVVDVIQGDHDASWYTWTRNVYHYETRWYRVENLHAEVYRKLGIVDFDPDHRVVAYPTARFDGLVGANFGGAWMDADDLTCIADGGLTYPYEADPAHCLGHVVHEFGHVFGLDHTGPEADCMQFGFYTDDPERLCSFSRGNVAQILADPDNEGWLEGTPGEVCSGR